MAKFNITDVGVNVTSGRGAAKVSIFVDFKALEDWAKRMKIDTDRLMKRSFGRACSALKKKFYQVVANAGGVCGVPKFKDFEEFTKELRTANGTFDRPMGGKLAKKSSIVAYKRNGWQIIGWHDNLMEAAMKFQDAVGGEAENQLNDNRFRHRIHMKGIKDIPRTYVHNKREVLPEPFGEYVEENLEKWASTIFYKELARMMVKATGQL